jgi:hypothetical protein
MKPAPEEERVTVDVILERAFEPPLSVAEFTEMALDSLDCMALYRAEWQESLLAKDGKRIACRFRAPDAESVRMIAQGDRAIGRVAWTGVVEDSGRQETANVMVERRFSTPVTMAEIQAIEDAAAWCLEQHRVTFLRTFFSADRTRMLCLYRAPDAESVRQAQAQAGMPLERVWACRCLNPATLAAGGH